MEHDMELISLWPSVESRLKMLDIITVRVITVTELILQLLKHYGWSYNKHQFPFKGTLSRRFWRYGECLAWCVLRQVWNQSRCNGTSERVTSRTGSYKACPNEAVTSLLCLHKRSVWNCPCLIWCCLSVLNYSEMASKLLVCAFIPARVI